MEAEEVIPSAKRLIKSLRDVGYEFPTAVADIVDNSIEWGATAIDIDVIYNAKNSYVRISDNGKGMDEGQIKEAMRFGSERKYKKDALGKFGLGLKTASLSQCRYLAVASRNVAQGKISHYCWDIDYIESVDKWEILKISEKKIEQSVFEPLNKNKGTGTVIFWWRLDRILEYKHPRSEAAQARIASMCRDLEMHLAMVFHRFLSGDVQNKKKVEISLNGNIIEPWDPFARKEKTIILQPSTLTVEHDGVAGTIIFQPYILPSQQEFSTLDEFNKAGGPEGWNHQQGFYVYRADRLIQSGGWCRLRVPDEHTKLARAALSFSPELDDAFKLNVSKMQAQLPSEYRDWFDSAVKTLVKAARERYDKKGTRHSSGSSGSGSPKSISTSASDISNTGTGPAPKMWTLDELEGKILKLAKPYQRPMLKKIFEKLRKNLGAKDEQG